MPVVDNDEPLGIASSLAIALVALLMLVLLLLLMLGPLQRRSETASSIIPAEPPSAIEVAEFAETRFRNAWRDVSAEFDKYGKL
jgi:hypothetical protein